MRRITDSDISKADKLRVPWTAIELDNIRKAKAHGVSCCYLVEKKKDFFHASRSDRAITNAYTRTKVEKNK